MSKKKKQKQKIAEKAINPKDVQTIETVNTKEDIKEVKLDNFIWKTFLS